MSKKVAAWREYCPNQKGCKYVEMAVEIGRIANIENPNSKVSENFDPDEFRKLNMIHCIEFDDGAREYSCGSINKCTADMYSTPESKKAECSYLSMVQKILGS